MSPTDLVYGNPRFVLGVHRIELPNDLLDLLAIFATSSVAEGPHLTFPKEIHEKRGIISWYADPWDKFRVPT